MPPDNTNPSVDSDTPQGDLDTIKGYHDEVYKGLSADVDLVDEINTFVATGPIKHTGNFSGYRERAETPEAAAALYAAEYLKPKFRCDGKNWYMWERYAWRLGSQRGRRYSSARIRSLARRR